MRLFEDLTFREIRGHQIKYDFVLEKTGLETRPTYTCCNVRENLDRVATIGEFVGEFLVVEK